MNGILGTNILKPFGKTKYYSMDNLLIENINGVDIVLKGIGKFFFQDGFPISMSISIFREKNIKVSLYHIASECMQNGWSSKTTFNKLMDEIADDIDGNTYDITISELEKFCYASYEKQREIIFDYLFSNVDYKKWLINKMSSQSPLNI